MEPVRIVDVGADLGGVSALLRCHIFGSYNDILQCCITDFKYREQSIGGRL